jgi:ribosomal protein L12E/L44/L45/RPP1/RPP2
MNVLLPKQFNVDKIKYSEMKIMKSGAKSIYVNYQGYKINIQTPVLNIPYGVNDNMQFIKDDPKRKDETQKYDITVSFKGIDENQKIKVFHDKLIELENKILEDAFANRVAWFKNNFDGNKGTVSNMFSRIIRRDKDKETGMFADKYPPTFKAKIPYDSSEDKFDFDSYDMDNNEIDFKDYVSNLKGGKAQFIIQLTGIWFSAGMFGCSWKIVSAKFQKVNSSKITFVKDSDDDNVDDDEDDDDIEVDTEIISKSVQKHQVATDAAAASATTVSKTPVVSSKEEEEEEEEQEEEEEDDEEEEEDTQVPEPEPEPEPVKPAVKKVVNKKK